MFTESTKIGSRGLKGTKFVSTGPGWVCTKFFVYVMAVNLLLCGTPNSESGCFSDSFANSWDSFPPIRMPCPDTI